LMFFLSTDVFFWVNLSTFKAQKNHIK